MPANVQKFYSDSMQEHVEEALLEAISRIVRLNKNGIESLNNDI